MATTNSSSAKISSKGQLTVPAAMRRALGTDRVRLTMKNGQILIEAEPDLTGALAHYARGTPQPAQEREQAWALETHARHGKARRR